MKKLLTVAFAVLLAASVQAQTTYATNQVVTAVVNPVVTTTTVQSGGQTVTTSTTNLVAGFVTNQVVTTTIVQQTPGTATPPAGITASSGLTMLWNDVKSATN